MELELEGFGSSSRDTLSRHVHPAWRVTEDGSLRNGGIELITNGGFGGVRLYEAFERLATGLERVNYDASFRCSTHMHINMLDFTVNQVVRFLLVYTACEPVLFEFCGAYRKSSNFCTPVTESLAFHRKLINRMYDDAVIHRTAVQQTSKYTALNLAPLFPSDRSPALGTVEFRGGRPLTTVTDMALQANLLLSIKEYVRTFEGTEDALLTALSAGLNNTVYANGVAAQINTPVEALENALIHSWCLLKSYQEGIAYAAKRKSQRAASPEEDFDEAPEGVEIVPARPTFGARLREAAANTPRDWSQINVTGASGVSDMAQLEALISSGSWSGIHRRAGLLVDPSSSQVQSDAYWSVMSTTSRIHKEDKISIFVNYIATKSHTEGEDWSLVNRMCGAWLSTNQDVSSIPRRRLACVTGRMDPMFRPDHRIDYKSALPQADWNETAGILEIPANRMTNTGIWALLRMSTCRLKNRTTLVRLATELGHTRIVSLLSSTDVVAASKAYTIFRMLNVPSFNHVFSADRAAYDKVASIMMILSSHNLTVPVVMRSRDTNEQMGRFMNAAATLGLAINGYTTQQQSTPPRETAYGLMVY